MIIVNISGGLGNQMFQYAFGKVISIEMNKVVHFSIDSLSSYDSIRRFDLEDAFKLIVTRAHPQDISEVLNSWRSLPRIRRILARLDNNFLRGPHFFTEKNIHLSNPATSIGQSNAYLHGYWQSEDFFSAHKSIIREAFQFRSGASIENQKIMMSIRLGLSIGMHVRRGDYVTNSKTNAMHGVLDVKYYFSAIASLRQRLPTARIFIFTDDPDWVCTHMLDKIENSECVNINSGRNSFRDMQLMAMCDHNIVANSSFSWWSAWLNSNPQKIVIAPQRWFSNQLLSDTFLVPSEWERI